MDNQAIGNYIKRLRQRAGQTQADLGTYLHVTDKAISRWESGLGMPEIGNLMAIAKLYGVKVDDILECSEEIFESTEVPAPANAPTSDSRKSEETSTNANTVSESANPPQTSQPNEAEISHRQNADENGVPAKEKQEPRNARYDTDKFLTMMFFAFLAVGVTTFSSAEGIILAFVYIFTVVMIGVGVIHFLSRKWNPGVRATVLTVIYACWFIAAMVFVVCIFVQSNCFSRIEGSYNNHANGGVYGWYKFSTVVWSILLLIQSLYAISELLGNHKIPVAIMRYVAFGLACAFVIPVALLDFLDISELMVGLTGGLGGSGILGINMVALVLPLFAASLAFLRPFYLAASGGMALGMIFFLILPAIPPDLPFYVPGASTAVFPALSLLAPALSCMTYFFEGKRCELLLTRICAGVSCALLIPLTVYTFDVLASSCILGMSFVPHILVLRLLAIATAIFVYVGKFRFDLFFSKKNHKEALQ